MNKNVYLHELDSVRNSPCEIEHAQQLLFQEIVCNGNCVVITFNQIADSKALLELVAQNDDMSKIMQSLMKNGAIKISRFNDKRTAAQYLIDGLSPTNLGTYGNFVLSGWDLPKDLNSRQYERLREGLYKALRNSDPDYMDRLSKSPTDSEEAFLEEADTSRIKRLVDFILQISKAENAYIDANPNPSPNISQSLEMIRKNAPEEYAPAFKHIENISSGAENMNRSAYYKGLGAALKESSTQADCEAARMAFQVIDLAYNITTESSIRDISPHYLADDIGSLAFEVKHRLEAYSEDYSTFKHAYEEPGQNGDCISDPNCKKLWKESEPIRAGASLDWKHAERIRSSTVRQRNRTGNETKPDSATNSAFPLLYEANSDSESKEWRSFVSRSLWKNILIMLLYAVILGFIEVIISLIQDIMVDLISQDSDSVGDLISLHGSVMTIVVFGIGILFLSRGGRTRRPWMPMLFIAVLFFVLMPMLNCISISFDGQGSIEVDFAQLPSMLLMGIPSLLASFIGVCIFSYVGNLMETRLEVPGLFDSARSAYDSMKDLVRFSRESKGAVCPYSNSTYFKDHGSPKWNASPDAWAEKLHASSQKPVSQQSNWEKYLSILEEDEDPSSSDGSLRIIKDLEQIHAFERNPNGRNIGILYESPYMKLVVDLVEDFEGNRFAYERILPNQKSAAVIIPILNGKIILLDQYRHALRDHQLCFPRGFGEENLSPEENACKELFEEIGADVAPENLISLGTVVADSGISGNEVSIFMCNIQDAELKKGYEGIGDILMLSDAELNAAIASGKITDGYTLSAFMLWKCKGGNEAFLLEDSACKEH